MRNVTSIVADVRKEHQEPEYLRIANHFRKLALDSAKNKTSYTIKPYHTKVLPYPYEILIHEHFDWPCKETPVHNHDFFELVYVYKGSCCNTCSGIKTILKEKDLLLMNPDAFHSIQTHSNDDVLFNFMISREVFHQSFLSLMTDNLISNFVINYFYQMHKTADFMIINYQEDSPLYMIMDRLIMEYFNKLPGYERILESGLIEAFLYMSRIITDQYSPNGWYPASPLVSSVLLYIYKNYAAVTLTEVAYIFGYSSKYISRLLKKELNVGFSEIIQEIRLNHAIQYLQKTTMTIEQIAQNVGYQNVSHFYDLFRNKYQLSPREYRQQNALLTESEKTK